MSERMPDTGSIEEREACSNSKAVDGEGGKKPEVLVLGEEWPILGHMEQRSGEREADAAVRFSNSESMGGVPRNRSSSLPYPQAQPPASKHVRRYNGDRIGNHYNGAYPRPAMMRDPTHNTATRPLSSYHPSHFQATEMCVYQAYPYHYPSSSYQQRFPASPTCYPFVDYYQTTAYEFNPAHRYHVEWYSRPNHPLVPHFRPDAFFPQGPYTYPDTGFTNGPCFYGNASYVPDSPADLVGIRPAPFNVSSIPRYHSPQHEDRMDIRPAIARQVEYYFSDQNLPSDAYLLSLLDKDGWVSIHSIKSFNKLNMLAKKNTQLILDALRSSNFIEVLGDKIRRRHWSKWIQAPSHHASSSNSHVIKEPSHLNHEVSNNIGASNSFCSKSSPVEGAQGTPEINEVPNLVQKDCLPCINSADGLDTLNRKLQNVRIIAELSVDFGNVPCSEEDKNQCSES